jgi:hypothetical protein
VLAVIGKRRLHRHAEGMLLDLDVDPELSQGLVQAPIEVGDRDTVGELEGSAAAVVRPDEQRVVDEVEVIWNVVASWCSRRVVSPRTST